MLFQSQNLKNFCITKVEEYAYNFLKVSKTIKFKMTISWCNKTPPGGYHHIHTHSNSLISGTISVTSNHFQRFHSRNNVFSGWILDYDENTDFNAEKIDVKLSNSGTLTLFPSWIHHEVPIHQGIEDRYSLSFNILPQGLISPNTFNEALII